MKYALLILLLLTSPLFADKKPKRAVTIKDTPPPGIKTDVGGHLIVESSGIVTLTKKGQRARYNIVGASKEGTLLLGLNPKINEGAFKVQLAKGAEIRFIEPKAEEDGSARTDLGGHLLVKASGSKMDVAGYLMIEASEIVTVWVDSWPPPIRETDNAANLLIVKAFGLLVSYGEIKLKKPSLTAEQRAERAQKLLQPGTGLLQSEDTEKPKSPVKSDR